MYGPFQQITLKMGETSLTTIVTSESGKRVVIGNDRPVTIIGEKINPTGKKKLSEELLAGGLSTVREYAISQVEAGAHIVDVNVGVAGIEEEKSLPQAVEIVMKSVDCPLSIDSANPKAIEAALKIYTGKAIVNSVTGEEKSLNELLPIVKKYQAAVIALPYDEAGPTNDPYIRIEVARKILKNAQKFGIAQEDVLIDGLVRPVSVETNAAKITLHTIRLLSEELGVNTVLGISNVSFGLPDRKFLNAAFLAMAVAQGLTCAIIDPTVMEIKKTLLGADLFGGHDEFAARWIGYYRANKALQ